MSETDGHPTTDTAGIIPVRLTREVRLFALTGDTSKTKGANSWAGSPNSEQLGTFWRVSATVQGAADAQTGYVCSLSDMEATVRNEVLPHLIEGGDGPPESLPTLVHRLSGAWRAVGNSRLAAGALTRLALWASPYLRLAVHHGDHDMVRLTQSFEFSASHRLYVPELSDSENDRLFGKCANVNGHGHNYVLEVTIRRRATDVAADSPTLPEFERIVKECVVDRFDHKYLNLDCREFADRNPTVENIASVIWEILSGSLRGDLLGVRVWETPKTYAECGYDQ